MASIPELRRLFGPAKKRLADLLNSILTGEVDFSGEDKIARVDIKLGRFWDKVYCLKQQIREQSHGKEAEEARLVDEAEEFDDLEFKLGEAQDLLREALAGLHQSDTGVMRDTHPALEIPEPRTHTDLGSQGGGEGDRELRTNRGRVDPGIHEPIADYGIKLHKLSLPVFQGDILEWQGFWDAFQSAVHLHPHLRPVDKLNYLQSQLAGAAKTCISGLPLTNANYEVAISLLKDRFGDKRLLIDRLYRDLNAIRPASNNIACMRNTLDCIEKTIRSLQSLGEDVSHNSFIPIIKSKFPVDILVKLEEQVTSPQDYSTQRVREVLHSLVSIRERVEFSVSNQPRVTGFKSESMHISTAEALPTAEIKCCYCNDSHWSDECSTYPTLDSRLNKMKGRCFICFDRSHFAKDCKVTNQCFYCKKVRHHRSLCFKNPNLKKVTHKRDESSGQVSLQAVNISEEVIMQTAVVTCGDTQGKRASKVRLLFDSGSQRTYITNQLVEDLGLEPFDEEELLIFSFSATEPKKIKTASVKFNIQLSDGNVMKLTASVVPYIIGKEFVPVQVDGIRDTYKGLIFAEEPTFRNEIKILIGNNYYCDFFNMERIKVSDGLYLINSKVGWILGGRKSQETSGKEHALSFLTYTCSSMDMLVKPDLPLNTLGLVDLKNLWDLEVIGIRENPDKGEDDKAVAEFNRSICFKEERYHVSWPWKEYPPTIESNYFLALNRLGTLVKRLHRNPTDLSRYSKIITDQLAAGVVELVTDRSSHYPIHYIPHHAVITPSKSTTKLRIVYDASSRPNRFSKTLNECLLKGRLFLEDLVGLLLRFRTNRFALICDIEKAFLQIGLNEDSRDVTRFLWLRDYTAPVTPENIIALRFTRVGFGFISSPFLLAGVITHHLEKKGTRLAELLKKNIYVDNVALSYTTEDTGTEIYTETKAIFRSAAMNIREWSTNSSVLRQFIPEDDRAEGREVKVLGICWDTIKDHLRLSWDDGIQPTTNWTKRSVLRFISSTFDPLGLVCPAILLGKLYIRNLWIKKIGWDDKLDESTRREWDIVYAKIQGIDRIKIDRWLSVGGEIINTEFHCFTDASSNAYSAVIYLRTVNDKFQVNTSIIIAKARLSPLRDIRVSIPRLELLGVVIGVKLLKFVERNMNIDVNSTFLWSDSKCVLGWLTTTKPLPLFIEKRVDEIKKARQIRFRHVSGLENPADIATRGLASGELAGNRLWWDGPGWLRKDEESWPTTEQSEDEVCRACEAVCTTGNVENCHVESIPPFGIDYSRYSSLIKLLRITVYCDKFVKACRRQKITINIDSEDISRAKRAWEIYIQRIHFGRVVDDILNLKYNPLQKQLRLWLDDEVLRCRGRLINSELCDNSKFPKLLPKCDNFTRLVVESVHKKLFHAGTSHTLAMIREEYWIPHGRAVINKIIRGCLVCRRYNGAPYKTPDFPPLPVFRVTRSTPFTNTGIDYFGPLYVRKGKGCHEKCWVCIFTCLVTRAVHLELLENMTSEEFLLAFRRFIARRCLPRLVVSDNAGQFKLGKVVFNKIWDKIFTNHVVQDFSSKNNIEWRFIPEFSPWMGGVYERVIGLTKNGLRKHLGRSCLTFMQLSTVISEIEAILNSRPLIHVETDGLGEEIITPAHFIGLQFTEPIKERHDEDSYGAQSILIAWKKGHNLLNQFWHLWREQYLKCLREQRENTFKKKRPHGKDLPKLDDVVHIKNKGPRAKWNLGKIIGLNRSREDGEIRSVKLKVENGEITRPVGDVFPLEATEETSEVRSVATAKNNYCEQMV